MEFSILYAINNIHNEILDKIMLVLTNLGDSGIFWIVLAIAFLFHKRTRKCGLFMLVSMLLGLIVGNGIIKNLVARQRPCWIDGTINLLIPNPTDFSFPSGHTLASFEAAVTIFLHNKKWGIPFIILASLIGVSRLYLFVHFPTDVLAGAVLGTAIAILVFILGNLIEKKIYNKTELKKENANIK